MSALSGQLPPRILHSSHTLQALLPSKSCIVPNHRLRVHQLTIGTWTLQQFYSMVFLTLSMYESI